MTSESKKDLFKYLKIKAERELQKIKDNWWYNQAHEVKLFVNSNNFQEVFFQLSTAEYGPCFTNTMPVLSSDGITLLKDKGSIIEWWRGHFCKLLNKPFTVDPIALDIIPQK